jgi:hypothetical protein
MFVIVVTNGSGVVQYVYVYSTLAGAQANQALINNDLPGVDVSDHRQPAAAGPESGPPRRPPAEVPGRRCGSIQTVTRGTVADRLSEP